MKWDCEFACGDGLVVGEAPQGSMHSSLEACLCRPVVLAFSDAGQGQYLYVLSLTGAVR